MNANTKSQIERWNITGLSLAQSPTILASPILALNNIQAKIITAGSTLTSTVAIEPWPNLVSDPILNCFFKHMNN